MSRLIQQIDSWISGRFHRRAPSGPDTPVSSAAPEAPGPAVAQGPALVVDAPAFVHRSEGLDLFVGALFETSAFSAVQQEVLLHLKGRSDLWGDREALLRGAHDYLTSRLQTAGRKRGEFDVCLRALEIHRRKTRESRSAYTTHDKPNWDAVYWPNPAAAPPHRASCLFDKLPFVRAHPFLTFATPVGSAGSCFAMEIAFRLQRDGFNYIITEPMPVGEAGLPPSCARWGTIFNTPSLRQLVEKAFGHRALPKILYRREAGGEIVYLDPFREDVVFKSVEEYEASYESHHKAVRRALLAVRVFVFTLGMNEVWRMKADGSVFSRAPWGVLPDLVEKRVLTVEENLAELRRTLQVWRTYNPELKLILSVSPVPLHATFRGDDTHVITANCHSKSLLRVVAEEFTRTERDVYYLPSYETVLHCTRNPWNADQRHVSPEAVDKVMDLFRRMYVHENLGEVAAPEPRAA